MSDSPEALRSSRGAPQSGPGRRVPSAWLRRLAARLWMPRRRAGEALPTWLHLLVASSDDGLRLPGTRVRFGLDALIGLLLPVAGDALGGVTAAILIYVAWRRGAPSGLLYAMLGNAALDMALGSIPIIGDVFDVGFHANRRNLILLEDFVNERSPPRRASRLSAALVLGALALVMLLVLAGLAALAVLGWRELQA